MSGFKGALAASAGGPTTPPSTPYTVEYFIVGGGGGGGSGLSPGSSGGGGGAGGYTCGSNSMAPGDTVTVAIGAGGTLGSYCRQLPAYPGASGWAAGCQGGCTTMSSPNPNYNNIVAHSGGGGGTHTLQAPGNNVYGGYYFNGSSGPAPNNPLMPPVPPGPGPLYNCGSGQGRPGGSGGGSSGNAGLIPCGTWGAPSCVPGQGNGGGNTQSFPTAAFKGGSGGGGAGGAGDTNFSCSGVGTVTNSPNGRLCCTVLGGRVGGVGITWGPATYAGGGSGGSNWYCVTAPSPAVCSCVSCVPGPSGGGGNGGLGGQGGGTAPICTPRTPLMHGGNGTTNTGGGGGGAGTGGYPPVFTPNGPIWCGGNGGSGAALFRYPGPPKGTGGTISTPGDGYTYHCFTGAGTFTA